MDNDRGQGQDERAFVDLMPGPDGQQTLFTLGYYSGSTQGPYPRYLVEVLQWKNWNDGGAGGA